MAAGDQGQITTTTLFNQGGGQLTTKEQRAGKRESVRSQIALYYIIGFFSIIFLGLIIGWCRNFEIKDYKDMMISISGILSGPLGFIIGFYFKDSSEN
jgi:hypothetical protein